jgi:hypothetical protein
MPSLQKLQPMFDDEHPQPVQFVCAETVRFCKAHWFQPKFGKVVAVLYVNVGRLRSFQAVKEEPESGDPQTVGIV